MKEKIKNFGSIFSGELSAIGCILFGVGVYFLGYFINKISGEREPVSVNNILIGVVAILLIVLAILIALCIILGIISLIQLIIGKAIVLHRINKNPISEEDIKRANYKSVKECLYNVIPQCCRRKTIYEKDHEYPESYVFVSSTYADALLPSIEKVFSTPEYEIETFLDRENNKIGYRKIFRNNNGKIETVRMSINEVCSSHISQ